MPDGGVNAMNLDEALAQTAPRLRGPRSNLDKLLEACDDDTREQVLAAIANPQIETAHLERALTKLGQENGWIVGSISDESIRKRRRGHEPR